MKTRIEFRSDKCPAYESEAQEINPGRYGKRVAELLSGSLRSHGFEPEDLIAEDWGWLVPIKEIDTQARVEALEKAMDTVLSESAGIRDKKWWTHEEFNNPRT